jgi:hypothetical protein
MIELCRYLHTRQGRSALALVTSLSIMLGYFIERTYFRPLPHRYSIDFRGAQWIQTPTPSRTTYFRKDIYLTDNVQRAWIALAATGSYQLVVNNVELENNQLPAARPATVQDISRLLSPGENVIAVYVGGESSFGPRQLLARGAYQVTGSSVQEFVSDSSWKASAIAANVPGRSVWSAVSYDDSLWPNAVGVTGGERWSTVQQVSVDPRLFELAPAGNWIMSDDQTGQMTFTGELILPQRPQEAWLQLASNGSYDVVINGRVAIATTRTSQASMLGPKAPVQLSGADIVTQDQLPSVRGPSSGLPGSHVFSAIRVVPRSVPGPYRPGSANPSDLRWASARLPLEPQRVVSRPESVSATNSSPNVGLVKGFSSTLQQLVIANSFADAVARSAIDQKAPRASIPTDDRMLAPERQVEQQLTRVWSGPSQMRPLSLPWIMQAPFSPPTASLSSPSLNALAPDERIAAPQIMPLTVSPGPRLGAGLMLTDYDVSSFLRADKNTISVRVYCDNQGPVLFASGLIGLPSGDLIRFGSDGRWRATGLLRNEDLRGGPAHLIVAGKYEDSPNGPPVQVVAGERWLPWQDISAIGSWTVILICTTLVGIFLWLFVPILLRGHSLWETLWNRTAIVHLFVMIPLLMVLFSSYDVRFPYDWCFRRTVVIWAAVALIAGQLILTCIPTLPRLAVRTIELDESRLGSEPAWHWTFLLIITAAGMVIRAVGTFSSPLGHDEVAMALLSQGIPKAGYPYMIAGSYTRILSTYELVPYPMALFAAILGPTTLAYRLPALIFGSLLTLLIGWSGRRMFDWRVGLSAAAIWAFLPVAVRWSSNGFYLSQEGLFALATFLFFYEAIRDRHLNRRYLDLSAAAFVLSYFSWEASGFMLPALAAGVVVLRWRDWEWLGEVRLWRNVAVVGTIVVLQLLYRQLTLMPTYTSVVKDLSDVTTPGLVPFDRLVFDPLYYVRTLFLAENHVVLTLVALIAMTLAAKRQALIYLFTVLVALYVCYTVFLDHYAPRYCFNWLPLLVLAGCGSFFVLWDHIIEIPVTATVSIVRNYALGASLLLFIMSANGYVTKLFRMAPDPAAPVWFDRIGVPFMSDYQSADEFVAHHMKPGDVVVTSAPHVFRFVTGFKPDYSLNADMLFRMVYDEGPNGNGYIDKWMGVPVLRDVRDIEAVQTHASRVWLLSDTDRAQSVEVRNYIQNHGLRVYESTAQQVDVLPGLASE